MTDSEDLPKAAAIPSWQQADEAEKDDDEIKAETQDAEASSLKIARRFLDDEGVKDAPREKKIEFLKSKGVSEDDVQKLLGSPSPSSQESTTITTPPDPKDDRPPIITYPEFLTKPTRPPPLVTTSGLLSTAYAFTALSTLVYGTSKYVVAPMVETLTESRIEMYEAAGRSLDSILGRLEKTVSSVPASADDGFDDEDSDFDDPSEMFHRDIGTQTATPVPTTSPSLFPGEEKYPPSLVQATRIATLTKKLSFIRDGFRAESEDLSTVKALVDVFRDDLDTLTFGGGGSGAPGLDFTVGGGGGGGYDSFGRKKGEPDDEIKKAKDNIRRVKGVLLSTRNFPASTR